MPTRTPAAATAGARRADDELVDALLAATRALVAVAVDGALGLAATGVPAAAAPR